MQFTVTIWQEVTAARIITVDVHADSKAAAIAAVSLRYDNMEFAGKLDDEKLLSVEVKGAPLFGIEDDDGDADFFIANPAIDMEG
jgi:hypothetical protein